MVGKPASGLVRPGIGFVVRATGNTGGTWPVDLAPVLAAGFSIYRPLQYTATVRYINWLDGPFSIEDGLRWTQLGTVLAYAAKFSHTEFYWFIGYEW